MGKDRANGIHRVCGQFPVTQREIGGDAWAAVVGARRTHEGVRVSPAHLYVE